jgi:nucleoside-diphosphate-sugar epimerase
VFGPELKAVRFYAGQPFCLAESQHKTTQATILKSMKLLVLGGSGVISRAIVAEAVAAGHEVTVFNRGRRSVQLPYSVRMLQGDKQDRDSFAHIMASEHFDAVIDMICYTEEDARHLLSVFGGRVQQLIVTSTSAAYKRPFNAVPVKESREQLLAQPGYDYGYNKACMERYLLPALAAQPGAAGGPAFIDGKGPAQADANGSAITVIRPSLTFGEGSANVGVLRQNIGVLRRIQAGKELISFGDGTMPWSFTWAGDLAKAYVLSLGNQATFGQTWHITSSEQHVWDDLYRAFGRVAGKEPVIRHLPSELLVKIDTPLFEHLFIEKSHAGVFDTSVFRTAVPAWRAETSLDELVSRLVNWFEKEAPQTDPAKDVLEDTLVGLWHKWAGEASLLR